MAKNVLITGGAGFIGSRLGAAFVQAGYTVTLLDNFGPQVHGEESQWGPHKAHLETFADVIIGDVTSRDDLVKALADKHIVVHLAAETGTGQSMYDIEKYSRVNIGGTALLLDLLANSPNVVEKVVVASSRSIYGEGRYRTSGGEFVYPQHRDEEAMLRGEFDVRLPTTDEDLEVVATPEEARLHPSSVYGITKLAQEQLVMTVCSSLGIGATALRYQNVYGPGQSLTNPYTGILSIFSSLIRQGKQINVFEDGMESRDFVFVDDVVRATFLAAVDGRSNDQVFNVGSGVATTVLSVVEELTSAFERSVPIVVSGNFRLGDIRHNYSDTQKIREVLGFEPHVAFADGIKRFVAWVLTRDEVGTQYDKSIAELREKNLMK